MVVNIPIFVGDTIDDNDDVLRAVLQPDKHRVGRWVRTGDIIHPWVGSRSAQGGEVVRCQYCRRLR